MRRRLTLDPASYIPSSKLPAIARAVNAACDAQDGVTDGILNDPEAMSLRSGSNALQRRRFGEVPDGGAGDDAEKLYEGPNDAKGRKIFPGYLPGAEEGPGGMGKRGSIGLAPGKSLLFRLQRRIFFQLRLW